MTSVNASVDEQMAVLMRGVEYGDPNIQAAMEEDLRAKLALGKPLRVYCGFDPTAVDLHLGHLIPMLKLRQFQQFGHEVTFLIGTMTGIVGDPSDKTAARQMLTTEIVEANAKTWLRQAFRVLDEAKTVVRRNGDWLAPLTFAEVVELAANFTVSQFLDHETYRRRLAENKPLYLHEFIYALMQAYDAFYMETDVQVGGVEQLFNIMAGRQLQRARGQRPLTAVCLPILTGTDGNLRMSKSTGNYIGLDDPPADMYGKVMSIPDALMANYYTLLAGASAEAVAALQAGLEDRSLNAMEAKKRLARSVVALLYDDAQAAEAEAEFERVFQRREDPEEVVEVSLAFTGDTVTADLSQLLATAGAAESRSAARRLISQSAVEVDGVKAMVPQAELKIGSLIRVGRHRFLRIVDSSQT
jgi:tyrosyl-tRNA synthetase